MNGLPPWYLLPPNNTQMDLDRITDTKRFFENLEKEYKDKNKDDKKKPSTLKAWLLLGLFAPLIFVLYDVTLIWGVIKIIEMAQTIQIK